MTDIERRIGIEPLDLLLAKRHKLVELVADLRARYGPGGTWDALRKQQLSTIAAKIRAQATADMRKVTEAAIDEAAHASDEYATIIAQATSQRAELALLEDEIQAINDRVMRDQALCRFATAETRL